MSEPLLTEEDHRQWALWERVCRAHAHTDLHKRRIETALESVDKMGRVAPDAYAAFSGGKDSTALLYLLQESGASPRVMSVKDDLDFPGEEVFVHSVCSSLGFDLEVVRPPFSLQGWLAQRGQVMQADDDFHGPLSAFGKQAFYDVVAAYRQRVGCPGVYLGIRAEESRGRAMNYAVRGALYQKGDEWVCNPLSRWTGLDVFAYIFEKGAPVLDIYRCCRLHSGPSRVRKSWWLPGAHSRKGGMIWLKTYYPSLFLRLTEILPDAARLA